MSRKCQITGRGPQVGCNVSHAHNVSKRRFQINLQKVRVIVDGRVTTMRVSTRAIKSGLITKPPVTLKQRKTKVFEPSKAARIRAVAVEEEPVSEFFSETSVVSRIFKPKKTMVQEFDEEDEAMNAEELMSEQADGSNLPEK